MKKPSRLLVSFVSAAALGVAALTGCGGGDSESAGTTSGDPTVTTTNASQAPSQGNDSAPRSIQTGESIDKDRFSADMSAAMADIKSYEATTSMTMDMDGTELSIEGLTQVDSTDENNPKVYTRSTTSASGTTESIMIGDTIYIRSDVDSMWTKDTIDEEEQQQATAESGLDNSESMADDAASISYVGEATVNGAPAYKYEITDADGQVVTVYIDDEHRMVQFEFGGDSPMIATYSKFNEKFDITAPPADQVIEG